MSKRKIIIYQKYAMKPIILTDTTDDIESIEQNIIEVMKSKTISILRTATDSLIVRPSEIQAILISKKDNDIEEVSLVGE